MLSKFHFWAEKTFLQKVCISLSVSESTILLRRWLESNFPLCGFCRNDSDWLLLYSDAKNPIIHRLVIAMVDSCLNKAQLTNQRPRKI